MKMSTSPTPGNTYKSILQPMLDMFTLGGLEVKTEAVNAPPAPPASQRIAAGAHERGEPHRLPNLQDETGWVFIDHHRDGKRWRVSLTSWNARPFVRFQPWVQRHLGVWKAEKGQGFSVSLRDVHRIIDGLRALLEALPKFDPERDGGPCEPTR